MDTCATVWDTTPFTTNTMESKNKLSVASRKGSGTLIAQLEYQYQMDRLATQKHVAAEHDVTIYHWSDSQEAMAQQAVAKATWRKHKSSKTSYTSGPPDVDLPESSPDSGKWPITDQQERSRKKRKSERLVSVERMGEDKITLGWFDAFYRKGLGIFCSFWLTKTNTYMPRKYQQKTLSFCNWECAEQNQEVTTYAVVSNGTKNKNPVLLKVTTPVYWKYQKLFLAMGDQIRANFFKLYRGAPEKSQLLFLPGFI